jgi:hypothetical protein
LLPDSPADAAAQRRRWEHGHLRTLLTQVPRLILAGVARCRPDLLLLACDLAVPPLSLLTLLCAAGTLLNLAAWFVTGSSEWLVALLVAQVIALIALLVAWSRFARDSVSWLDILGLPIYVLYKVPLYLAAVIRPQRTWAPLPQSHKSPEVVAPTLKEVLCHEGVD